MGLMPWRTILYHDILSALFDVLTYLLAFWGYDMQIVLTSRRNIWRYDIYFLYHGVLFWCHDVLPYFLMSRRTSWHNCGHHHLLSLRCDMMSYLLTLGVYFTLWHTSWPHDVLFGVMTYFGWNVLVFDIITFLLKLWIRLDVMTNFLTPWFFWMTWHTFYIWHTFNILTYFLAYLSNCLCHDISFDVMMSFLTFWRFDLMACFLTYLLTLWHTFWRTFWRYDILFGVMICCLTSCLTFWHHDVRSFWRYDVFLTPKRNYWSNDTFWRHDVLLIS